MKRKYIVCALFFALISLNVISQDIKAITENGDTVLLKLDSTWVYVAKSNLEANFVEPTGDEDKQEQLKSVGATVADLKKHISVDNGCSIENIILKDLSEQLGNAVYIVDVCGIRMKYRRMGSVFFKDGESPLNQ